MNLSTYGANAILDGTAMPTTLYAKLHTGNPTAAGTANASANDARKTFTRDAAAAGATQNDAELTWAAPLVADTLTHLTLWDDPTAGNCWWVGALTGPVLQDGSVDIVIPVGDLDLSLVVWS